MANHHDSIALDWVRGEIQETLAQSQQSLEAYANNRDDTARLRFCLNYLHQVHGSLQMVELHGAAMLTEEMEALAQAVLDNGIADVDESIEILMRAMLHLPQYLEHLASASDDLPLVLLPLLNDLRAARGQALFSDTSLFKPDLSAAAIASPGRAPRRLDATVIGHVHKLREMYRFALAGILREKDLEANLEYLKKVILRLIKLCQQTPRGELWLAAGGFVDSIESSRNPVNAAVKAILEELDGEISRIIDQPADILQQPVPEALFKHLLYYVARAQEQDSDYIQQLTKRYRLDKSLPSDQVMDQTRERVSGPGRDAMRSVVGALNEELAKLKDQLDLFVRAGNRQNSDLEELLPGLGQVANTLAVLGLAIPKRVVTEQLEVVEKLCRQSEPADDGALMDIAEALLYVEATLAGLDNEQSGHRADTPQEKEPGSQELGDANNALLREARNSLEQVKTAVVNFIASHWNIREIEHVPALLHGVRGGLGLIPLNRVSALLESVERYLSDVLLNGKRVPDWKQLDTFADAITGIEYYLERLAEGIEDNDSILNQAEQNIRMLGFPVGEEPVWNDSEVESDAEPEGEKVPETPSVGDTTDNDLVDDEILEIFIEEAEEVLDTIRDCYPRLRDNHDDREALSEVRRAFHTLKGSGRLVGASSIGDLAWSVENMLNHVIDQSIVLDKEMFSLIDNVIERIPSLIEEFRNGDCIGDVGVLIERAEALSTTRKTGPDGSEPESEQRLSEQDETEISTDPAAEASTPEVAEASDWNDDLIDDEILEIFNEEAGEVLETIGEHLPVLTRRYEDRHALAEVRRAFHTLKGSGRMVGASMIGDISWSAENVLNRIIDGTVFMNDDVAGLLEEISALLPGLVADFAAQKPASPHLSALIERATALANGEIPNAQAMPEDSDRTPNTDASGSTEADDDEFVDPVLIEIFETEAQSHLETLQTFLADAGEKASVAFTDNLSRALHTLKGSAHTAGIAPIADIVTPLEKFIKDARAENIRADRDVVGLIGETCDFITQGLTELGTNPRNELPGTAEFLLRLEEVASHTLTDRRSEGAEAEARDRVDPQLIDLFLNEGLDILLDADAILDSWAAEPGQTFQLDTLVHELKQLGQGARTSGLNDIADLADALHETYTGIKDTGTTPDEGFFPMAKEAQENLINMMDQVAAGLATRPDPSMLTELAALRDRNRHYPDEMESGFADDFKGIDENPETSQPELSETEAPGPEQAVGNEQALDDELAEVFLAEAEDLIGSTAEALQDWHNQPENDTPLRQLHRDLHTLTGGARLANIPAIGDLAHELENLFEGLIGQRQGVTDALPDLLLRSHDRLAGMVGALKESETPSPAADLIAEIHYYMDTATGSRPVTDVGQAPATPDSESSPTHIDDTRAQDDSETSDLDAELAQIFLEEASEILQTTSEQVHQWQANPEQPELVRDLQRELHTLKGGARMARIAPIADIAHEMETLFERVADGQIEPTQYRRDLVLRGHDQLAAMVDAIAEQFSCPDAPDLIAELKTATSDTPSEQPGNAAGTSISGIPEGFDDNLIGIFLDEALEIQAALGECLAQWREEPDELTGITRLQHELHSLNGGARLADIDAIADLAEAWHDNLKPLIEGGGNQQHSQTLGEQALTTLRDMLTAVEEGRAPDRPDELITALAAPVEDEAGASKDTAPAQAVPEGVDPEILEIFLEEAGEILDQLEQLFANWRQEPTDTQFNQEAQRGLHTLKGGARLSQLSELGHRAHELETRLVGLETRAPDEATWQAITSDYDVITQQVEDLRRQLQGSPPRPEAAVPPQAPAKAADTEKAPKAAATKKAPNRQREGGRNNQETIRVSAPLLDDLVNLAGETSITRGRLENQTSDFGHTLVEMAATIERLREQLRRMDIETEAQILFRAEREHGPDYGEDFDPLEMDRYSSIQQLSRALSESSSDLADLRETMSDRVRDTETLLVQQSRINTELQEGLMKTRMIPFASMVPRLRRIVRQISGELGKNVEFDVRNAEGEMDRNILERMIAPLEHMLRNAVDHGIEAPEQRKNTDKPKAGHVTLNLSREGGEVVLRMIDDGAGIATDVVRDKAIAQGLLQPQEDLSDREILQFILQPGFSTAQAVTQISGRGVGMDVVASEIKQLGGSLDIDSVLGQGTTFTVRLPFTVSVNRALMVSTGEDFYAIPLNTIEGIVRVSTYELEEYYKPDAPLYDYAGQKYRLQYLGGLLHSDHQPKLQGQALPLPVILVRGAEQPIALQVDSLMGSREIVVKSLGPQFTSVRGVSGATILGDGNVVVILDLPAMIRSDILSERQRAAEMQSTQALQQREDRSTVVMVVDDSVTVRKVTSRLLERNGMDVITAKDGLDAVAQLQDYQPDIILLDIEMPRMDGFEVASFVRHDDNLKGTPICMITSRTGQKHRERALSLGVNEYLGKPFQETELLETIKRLTGHNGNH